MSELPSAFTNLGFRVWQRLGGRANQIFSPVSLATLFGLILGGARGRTAQEIEEILGWTSFDLERIATLVHGLSRRAMEDEWDSEKGYVEIERDQFVLRIANALFVESSFPIRPEYRALAESFLDSEITAVDFEDASAVATRINEWIGKKTTDRISQLVSPDDLTELTRLVAVNVVYFLAQWAAQFDEELTRPEPFHFNENDPGRTIDVPMMHQSLDARMTDDPEADFAAILLPYKAMSMLVILPRMGRLAKVESMLSDTFFDDAISSLTERLVDLSFPKFEIHSRFEDLRGVLRDLGCSSMSSEAADFSGITDVPVGLRVSKAIQEARITVDENGTEATAATVMEMELLGLPVWNDQPPYPFVVDRPFLFAILDERTRTVLFLGRVVNPAER